MRIAVLSNVNVDMLTRDLSKTHEVFESSGYGQWVSYAFGAHNELNEFKPEMIFLIIDGNALMETIYTIEDGHQRIEEAFDVIHKLLSSFPESKIVINTIDVRQKIITSGISERIEDSLEHRWGTLLQRLCAENNRVVSFDLREEICKHGRESIYSDQMWYLGSIPYSIKGIQTLRLAIEEVMRKIIAVRKKVLVCDLDNTLWGGVAGEVHSAGIVLGEDHLGAVYRDTQKRIKELSNTGVLLAVVSKNNLEDVDEIFKNNRYMVLKKEDFISIQCNWERKSANILNLAKELNLGLSSFVFLDDNPIERYEVKEALPEVEVVEFPKNIALLPETIERMYQRYFWIWNETKEDKNKLEQYKQEQLRQKESLSFASMDDYIVSLNIHIKLNKLKDEQFERTLQLINKTNQFNTNTLRFDYNSLAEYRNNKNQGIFVADVSDRFGDSGLVVVVMVRKEGEVAFIENFLMSCRVMGRKIEEAVFCAIRDRLFEEGVEHIEASYISSKKNKPVEDLYETLGFSLLNASTERKEYSMNIAYKKEPLLRVEWND